MKAVVLVGGLGTRLRPLTFAVPKPLLAIGDKPILQQIIERLREAGCDEIILATGYLSELIRTFCGDGSRFGVSIRYVHEEEPLGTAGPLALIRDGIEDDELFVLMNGDIVTNLNFREMLSFAREGDFDLTVGWVNHTYQSPYGVLDIENSRITGITEKPEVHHRISAGIYVVKGSAMRLVPEGRFFTVPDLIEALRSRGREVGAWEITDFWLGVEEIGHMEKVRDHMAVAEEQGTDS